MKYLPGAGQMKAADQYTIQKLGVLSLELMERAAAACVAYMKERYADLSRVCVVCGTGNNGGDGFAVARMLRDSGYAADAVLIGSRERCTPECREQIRRFENSGGIAGNEFEKKEYSIIVDALFGVGLSRDIEGKYREVIAAMNDTPAKKIAVDIPSGVCADTGNILGIAFRADDTVTFQNEKIGMKLYPGKDYAGEVFAADIGISEKTLEEDRDTVGMPEEEDYRKLLPVRREDSNKGTFGKVLVIAGSCGMSGAAYFNAKSAYLAGAGLVQIYTAEENRGILQQLLPEAILTSYRGYEEEELHRLLSWADVICIGSGIGKSETAERILETTLKNGTVPCVIDADGLNLMARHPEYFEWLKHRDYILTPHMKEMSRLTGMEVGEIKRDRLKVLREYTERRKVTCVLKDARTVIGACGYRPVLNPSGNSAMAKAGSGDILAGVIAGILAQTGDCRTAAVLGTYLHGSAGDFARNQKGSYSVLAEDIMLHIGTAMNKTKGETVNEKIYKSVCED